MSLCRVGRQELDRVYLSSEVVDWRLVSRLFVVVVADVPGAAANLQSGWSPPGEGLHMSAYAPTAAGGLAYSHPPVGDSAQRVMYQGLRLARFVASRRLVKPYSMGYVPGAAVGPLRRLPPPGDAQQCFAFGVLVYALASMLVEAPQW